MPSVAANSPLNVSRGSGDGGSNRLPMILVGLALLSFALFIAFGGCASSAKRAEFPRMPTTGLAASLEKPPKFSSPGASAWATDYTPSTSDFVDRFYGAGARDQARASLDKQGLQEVAHVLWLADKATQCDIVLLRFADVAGAADRLAFTTAPVQRNGALASYQLSLTGAPTVYYTKEPDSRGYRQAKVYVQVGKVVVEMFVSSSDDLPRDSIERWLKGQLAKLG